MEKCLQIRVYGIVQGIGFRPFVSRLADELQLRGDVCNKGSYVEIHAQAEESVLDEFKRRLVSDAPAVSAIIRLDAEEIREIPDDSVGEFVGDTEQVERQRFRIIKSMHEAGEIFVSPDLAICPSCRRELLDPRDRRYLHPFINCTDCGPRLTILDGMPYDRIRTSMKKFPMCPECEWEYTHPETRRFHAQPVCCNDCGPSVYLYDLREHTDEDEGGSDSTHITLTGEDEFGSHRVTARKNVDGGDSTLITLTEEDEFGSHRVTARKTASGLDAIRIARRIIREGGVIAVKGIGGFHLCCDAANDAAVSRLRSLKHRPMKPFAVMMRDMETVKRECVVPEGAEKILDGVQKPILILDRRTRGKLTANSTDGNTGTLPAEDSMPRISSLIAPDNDTVGVMLPYAPVQILLFNLPDDGEMTDTFVMTSGNPSGAPICRNDAQALEFLAPMCDAILSNDRDILLRADDSVMQWAFGKPYMVRRSRGYSPLPFTGPRHFRGTVLAIGGELKNTFCLAKDELYYPSPYVGDLADLRSVRAMGQGIARMEELLEMQPELVVCDMHPRYNSTAYAEETGLPCMKIQHHYAHVLSCMAENGETGRVIGISFDGTGYGTDGTIWGGEFLLSDPEKFERMGSIAPFRQAGGDLASTEGWRVALSLLLDVCGSEKEAGEEADFLNLCSEQEKKAVFFMLRRNVNTVTSTSAGRLFDAVSAILGIRRISTFEGEASIALEMAAKSYLREHPGYGEKEALQSTDYSDGKAAHSNMNENGLSEGEDSRFLLPTDVIIGKILSGVHSGEEASRLAADFHIYLADGILRGAERMRDMTGVNVAALSGGCFQNMLLVKLCRERLEAAGFTCLTHSLVPPNDGGIALGQAYAGMWYLNVAHPDQK